MDILAFLKDRTRLIRLYYDGATQPFNETLRRINTGEYPYVPSYSEDGEPQFLDEWIDASELLELTGRCSVSMLSASLHLYFKTWEYELDLCCGAEFAKTFKAEGLISGYRACLAKRVAIEWDQCPADLEIIEQIILARNRHQHPDNITTIQVTHAIKDRTSYPQPFFMSALEARLFKEEGRYDLFMPPRVLVTRDKLMTAIAEVESLCEWLEVQLLAAVYP